jgi:hypothetical protein
MIYFRPCYANHIELIKAQEAQQCEVKYNPVVTADMIDQSVALSAWVNELCVAAGGVMPVWGGRAVAWALFSDRARPAMTAIVRQLRFTLDTYPAKRIEMTVRAEFAAGCRLARVLGFRCETPHGMASFYPDGSTAYLYARTQP